MEKWSVGIKRHLVWTHEYGAPLFDTAAGAETWMQEWLATQPREMRTGLYSVGRMPNQVTA
jgi:hypothetical protein